MFTKIDKSLILVLLAAVSEIVKLFGVEVPLAVTNGIADTVMWALAVAGVYSVPNKPETPPATYMNSPWFIGLAAIAVTTLMLSGCAGQRPKVDSLADAIVVTAADVETAAQTVNNLCRNEKPGGECAPYALISTATKNDLRDRLQKVNDGLRAANRALAADEVIEADDYLARAKSLLEVLEDEIERLDD